MKKANANQGAAAPLKALVIDRARWLRGEGVWESRLLREADGKMCCLGFYALACGLDIERISGAESPRNVDSPLWPTWLFSGSWHSEDAGALMEINDGDLGEKEREKKIAALFTKHGVKVKFVGDAAPAAPKEPQP